MIEEIASRFPYWMTSILLVIGLYGMIAKHNLMKKIIGINIFQVAIILFFIAGSQKDGGTIPIVEHTLNGAGHVNPADFVNPLPHVLMLTAIVVAVAISGVALAFMIRIYREFRTLDEKEILRQLEE